MVEKRIIPSKKLALSIKIAIYQKTPAEIKLPVFSR
jgi:hypothetical protein